jgi:prolipoprotein diacylglyceryltransferase
MINIGLAPLLLTLGSFSVSWHSLFMAVAIVIGVWPPARLAAKARPSVETLSCLALRGGILEGNAYHADVR